MHSASGLCFTVLIVGALFQLTCFFCDDVPHLALKPCQMKRAKSVLNTTITSRAPTSQFRTLIYRSSLHPPNRAHSRGFFDREANRYIPAERRAMIQSTTNTATKTLRHRTGFPFFIAPRTEKRVMDRGMTASARHIRPDNSLNHPAANLSDRRKAITAFLPAQSSVVRDLGPKP
jgi:hypothetical protein